VAAGLRAPSQKDQLKRIYKFINLSVSRVFVFDALDIDRHGEYIFYVTAAQLTISKRRNLLGSK
jgi:hypothetical protein